MRRELLVPKLGLTMTEGTLVEWLVKPGESFRSGQNIFVIESEKAATDIAAEADGVLLETTAEAGTTLAVGSVVGYWDERANGQVRGAGAASEGAGAGAAPASASAPSPAQTGEASQPALRTDGARTIATPLARRLARERGIDLATLVGSGPRGRIRSRDLPTAGTSASAAASAHTSSIVQAARPAQGPAAGDLRAATSTEQTIA
ncbi:MAG TPA: E3 binding domain-containing protein, partial [Burkholderiaceae bacterium]|nr:E3 binding domain-containing protein [Burkholderiaceae bacterium]